MQNKCFIAILGRQAPSAVERCRLAALRLRKLQIERDMERFERARFRISLAYQKTLQAIEAAEHAQK